MEHLIELGSEELGDYKEELECEGERHFLRNLEESGYSDDEAYDILIQVEMYDNEN